MPQGSRQKFGRTFRRSLHESFFFGNIHPTAKGVRQEESGKKVTKKVTEASEKVLQSLRPRTEVPNPRHWKQPKNSRKGSLKGCRVGHGKTAEKQPENSWNTRKTVETSCFGCFPGCFSAVLPWPTRHPFRLFFGCFQCRAVWHLL